MYSDTIIIGGGPGGMMAAGIASCHNNTVCLIEKNTQLGKKLKITGNGRCNLTNTSNIDDIINFFVPTNNKFLYNCLNRFTNHDLRNFFTKRGVELKEEDRGRIFPVSDNSLDIVNTLTNFLSDSKVKIMLNTKVVKILTENNKIIGILTDNGNKIYCNKLILATGGKSYPSTGSNGDGYRLAKQVGHTITNLKPALVPLITKQKYTRDIQGLSLKNVLIKIHKGTQNIFETIGEIIFTHYGISGPAALNASSYATKYMDMDNIKMFIDCIPSGDQTIFQAFSSQPGRSIKNSIADLIPVRLVQIILEISKIKQQEKWSNITYDKRQRFLNNIHNFELDIIGTKSFSHAMITSGGVDVKEINPYTMESKLIKNLYFAGELIDVDALTGGYNLQIAFSTGYAAGVHCRDDQEEG
ncbi:MAG: NAD(P)/FAD-dependent oxidoreductase [Clostridia bacterium]|nr:NAD(P)/FAD-dependent oxidoreductase [Clostridia bacterium]